MDQSIAVLNQTAIALATHDSSLLNKSSEQLQVFCPRALGSRVNEGASVSSSSHVTPHRLQNRGIMTSYAEKHAKRLECFSQRHTPAGAAHSRAGMPSPRPSSPSMLDDASHKGVHLHPSGNAVYKDQRVTPGKPSASVVKSLVVQGGVLQRLQPGTHSHAQRALHSPSSVRHIMAASASQMMQSIAQQSSPGLSGSFTRNLQPGGRAGAPPSSQPPTAISGAGLIPAGERVGGASGE